MSSWLIVGLGNPGPTYALTRHNIGYLVVEELAERCAGNFSLPKGLRAQICETRMTTQGLGGIGIGDKVILMKSQSFMNDSGQPVQLVAKKYQIVPKNVIVIHDELDLALGQLRLKFGGGDNGHNGLKSIRSCLGTGDFYRLRFGIGRPLGRQAAADYVLSRFTKAEYDELDLGIETAGDAVELLIQDGLAAAQNRYNS